MKSPHLRPSGARFFVRSQIRNALRRGGAAGPALGLAGALVALTPASVAAGPVVSVDGDATYTGVVTAGGFVTNGTATLGKAELGTATISGALNVTGSSTLGATTLGTATVTGNLSVGGSAQLGALSVSGTSTLGKAQIGEAEITGALKVGGAATFQEASITKTLSAGELKVTGASQLESLAIKEGLAVTGAASFGDLKASAIETQSLRVTGDMTIDGTLTLPSSFAFGELEVTGGSRLGDLEVEGDVRLSKDDTRLTLDSKGVKVESQGGGKMQVTDKVATLSHGKNGVTARSDEGTTRVTAEREASVQGGTTRLTLTDAGARLSGAGGAPARLSGIADGVERHDAVNVGQLEAGLNKMGAGIAMSMAMSQLPAPQAGSTRSFGLAVGTFEGYDALALGGSAMVADGVTLRAGLSHAGGQTGAGVGVGWSF